MSFKISTLSTVENDGIKYETGDLSVFPEQLDDYSTLYKAHNNCESKLRQTLNYNSKYIVCDDITNFPETGLLTLNNEFNFEIIYYNKRNSTTFLDLYRGFAGTKQNNWPIGTKIGNAVLAEHHNSTKDAILNIQKYLGTKNNPEEDSINYNLKKLENKFLTPKSFFRSYPLKGAPPLSVKFQNFCNTQTVRYLWDFGDGFTSSEKSPTHVYNSEGLFTVKLNIVTSTGAQGITIKKDYIKVSNDEITEFFYYNKINNNNYEFIDQTSGNIKSRYWVFNDGENYLEEDPYNHTIKHTYQNSGTYTPSLLIVFKDEKFKRIFLKENLTVE